ncbi:UNVERIFIED_CONTAM: hypothetical protein H355_015002 [Colinus virginianus]|nr:hypothetical protein H355_015002 [Colinus virginianus]
MVIVYAQNDLAAPVLCSNLHGLFDSALAHCVHVPFFFPRLREARQWVQQLAPAGGCNLLKALKHVLTVKELNSLVIIIRSCPDQSWEILADYAQQCMLGRKVLVHAVTYDCDSPAAMTTVKSLAEVVSGRYHCYSSEGENSDSSDVNLLLQESQKAKGLLKTIKQTFRRRVDGALISGIADVSTEVANAAIPCFLPKPPKHEGPLIIQTQHFLTRTSADWLKTNGLKGSTQGEA